MPWWRSMPGVAFEEMLEAELVGLLVALGARGPHAGSLAGIEEAPLDGGGIGVETHRATKRVNFADHVALPEPPDGGVAAHLADGVEVLGQNRHLRTEACRCEGGFHAGVAGADDDNIVVLWGNGTWGRKGRETSSGEGQRQGLGTIRGLLEPTRGKDESFHVEQSADRSAPKDRRVSDRTWLESEPRLLPFRCLFPGQAREGLDRQAIPRRPTHRSMRRWNYLFTPRCREESPGACWVLLVCGLPHPEDLHFGTAERGRARGRGQRPST